MSRTKLIACGYPIVELIAVWLVAQWIGWGSAIVVLLVAIPLGFIIMGKASRQRPVWFLAGLLVAIPGFVTDVVGLVLLLPPIQRSLERRGKAWLEANVTFLDFSQEAPQMRSPYDSGDVIPGNVVRSDDPKHDDGPPRGGPSITG